MIVTPSQSRHLPDRPTLSITAPDPSIIRITRPVGAVHASMDFSHSEARQILTDLTALLAPDVLTAALVTGDIPEEA